MARWRAGDGDRWQDFAEEPGAQEYARFLDRLRGAVNYGNEAFRQAVRDDLRQAAIRPPLRKLYFQLDLDASETCEDRITLTWNGMQTARLTADVEDGVYDNRLDALLQRGRVMFRLEALDGIARETVSSFPPCRPNADIEVYLVYRNQLRDPLELSHIAPDMRFLDVFHVSENDVAGA
ncbi:MULTISPECIES: NEL domain-containing protein [Bradyrhizobium]|uniref:NEL domain-containing protein n=1 Tax=Bradyrhizobium TaxID=374 RepID=UPI001E5AB9FF|nr:MULTISPECIES: NEL domain-containing protein [Bradyrhizobium]